MAGMLLWLVVGAALGYAGVRIFAGYPPAEGFRVLARREVAFLDAAADTMYPPGGPLPPSGSDARISSTLDAYLGIVPPRMRGLMRLLFFLLEHATLVFAAPPPRGRRRFSSLSPAQREAALEGWHKSPWFPRRLVFTSMRALLTNAYVADPAVLRHLGLAPFAVETPVCEADLLYPPIGRPRSAIHHAAITPPSDGTPLDPTAPRHPAYRELRP
jgi:gluconate 2-dehydrogenase subunit 3-like protein